MDICWWQKNLTFLEKIFNTPSHHRVHHARQEKYLDRNYAGVFIIWDRMLGTFMQEEDEPRFGIYPRFQSYDPVRANLSPIYDLFYYFRLAQGWDKARVLYKSPLWLFQNFKRGKDLSIRASKHPANYLSIIIFIGSLALAMIVLFIPTLELKFKIGLVVLVVALLKLLGRRLDQFS